MKSNKTLSIIVPVYNAEKTIYRCLDSLLPQLTNEDELLLIDDGSTDNSLSLIQETEKQYPDRVRVIHQENMGAANTRNRGIKEARGTYITFMDNDDFCEPDYLFTMKTSIKESQSDVVLCAYDRRGENEVLYTYKPVNNSMWYGYMAATPWAKIFRRDFLLDNQIEFLDYPLNEDIYFCLKAYRKSRKTTLLEYVGYHWYYNESSVSNTSQKGFSEKVDISYLMDKLLEAGGTEEPVNYFYTRHMIWYLLFAGRNSSKERFLKEYECLEFWTKKHRLQWKFPLRGAKIRGELLSRRIAIYGFLILRKLGLIPVFAGFYCKGKN